MSYTPEEIKYKVDKFVVVFVGSPRGVSTRTWVRNVPGQIKKILVNPESVTNKNRNSRLAGGTDDYKPELHICCVTGKYDSSDRYFNGEDHTIAGLDNTPFFPIWEDNADNWHKCRELTDEMFYDLEIIDDKHFMTGKIPIKKEKWEAYQNKVWDFADSVNFSYPDPYDEVNSWQETLRLKSKVIPTGFAKTPQAANQFLHFCDAYQDNKELFDSLTENSVVLRVRWDIHFTNTLWEIAINLLQARYYNRLKGEKSHVDHFEGFKVTPIALCKGISIIRGFTSATDYWHAFDGTGAQILGKYFKKWLLDDPDARLPHINVTDWNQPITKNNPFKIPESTIMQFLLDNNYTIYDYYDRGNKSVDDDTLQSFKTLLSDQWRYEWYEWTPEMVQGLRNIATQS